MIEPVVGIWMYRDSYGDRIQEQLKNILEKHHIKVINDFDMRLCYCLNGRVYTEKGFDLSNIDVLYHMNADEQTPFQRNILKALESSGVRIVNNFFAFDIASDKFFANLLLRNHGIKVAPSILMSPTSDKKFIQTLFHEWKSVVLKPRYSFGGKGIIKFDNYDQFIDFVLATKDFYEDYYLEKFIPFSDRDYRVEIFDGEYIASYSRKLLHSYKTNMSATSIHNKRSFLKNNPHKEQIEIAQKCAKILNLTTTIVDMVKSLEDGDLYVLEVNCMMGIFVQSANEALKIEVEDNDAYQFASDKVKLEKLANYILDIVKSITNQKKKDSILV